MISCILKFIERYHLDYKDILFDLHSYKEKNAKRKTYFEKISEKDSFWKKYQVDYECDFAANTHIIGVSNLIKGDWRKNERGHEENTIEIIEKLEEQLKIMPQSAYKIAFNHISWLGITEERGALWDSGVSQKYPLSSNVTIMNDYREKEYISLNFDMRSEYKNHHKYVDDFSDYIGCIYKKEVQFILDDAERKKYAKANLQVKKLLEKIEFTQIKIDASISQGVQKLHIKKMLKEVFLGMNVDYKGDGQYVLDKVDRYRNRLTIYVDYDKEQRSLCATLTYKGVGFKHSIFYTEVKPVLCDDIIKQYAGEVCKKVDTFVCNYVPKIIDYYDMPPEWYEWD